MADIATLYKLPENGATNEELGCGSGMVVDAVFMHAFKQALKLSSRP